MGTLEAASSKSGFRSGAGHRAPRHLEKLRLYQQWFAAALPLESAGTGQLHAAEPMAAADPRALHLAALEARLAASEADRAARLDVIEKQGAELNRVPGLEAERDALASSLAVSEADRAARLEVIEQQGAELGRIPGLLADLRFLAAELASLRATLENVASLAGGGPPKTVLGLALPSEVRRLSEMLAAIAALAKR